MRKVIRFGLAGLMALFLVLPLPVLASAGTTEPAEEKVYRLEKVVVSDHPLKDESLVVTPQATIINVDAFKKAGKVENVQDILSEALGATVLSSSVTPAQNEGIYIRGMDQSRYQIFMDGRPLRLHGSRGYFKMDWTTMPLDAIETIEIVRGSHSLLFPFSMGGAVNLITKKGRKTSDPTPHGVVKTGFGAYGAQHYSANINGGVMEAIGYSLTAGHKEGDGYLRGNEYDTDTLNGRFTLYLPTGGSITYGIDHVDTITGYAVINDPNDPFSNHDPSYPIVRNDVDTFAHDREGAAYAGGKNQWERTVTDQSLLFEQPLPAGQLRAQAYEQISVRDRYNYTAATATQRVDYKEECTAGFSMDYLDFDLIPDHSLSVGGEYRIQGQPENRDDYEITTFYLQDVWSLTDAMRLTYGTRWYEFNADSRRYLTPNKAIPDQRGEREWCPKVRLDYDWDDTLALYAAVSREMRLP